MKDTSNLLNRRRYTGFWRFYHAFDNAPSWCLKLNPFSRNCCRIIAVSRCNLRFLLTVAAVQAVLAVVERTAGNYDAVGLRHGKTCTTERLSDNREGLMTLEAVGDFHVCGSAHRHRLAVGNHRQRGLQARSFFFLATLRTLNICLRLSSPVDRANPLYHAAAAWLGRSLRTVSSDTAEFGKLREGAALFWAR